MSILYASQPALHHVWRTARDGSARPWLEHAATNAKLLRAREAAGAATRGHIALALLFCCHSRCCRARPLTASSDTSRPPPVR